MTTIYLIRHGEKEKNAEDTPLSEVGKKQAEITAHFLKDKNIDVLYASPMKRTQQTAAPIAHILNLPVITEKRLIERLNWGDRKGETFEEFLAEWTKTAKDRQYVPPFGDSSYNTGERVKAVLDEIEDNKNAVVVTHGGAIGDFLMNTFTREELPFTKGATTGVEYLEILECSITEVHKDNKTYILKKVNDTAHLPIPLL